MTSQPTPWSVLEEYEYTLLNTDNPDVYAVIKHNGHEDDEVLRDATQHYARLFAQTSSLLEALEALDMRLAIMEGDVLPNAPTKFKEDIAYCRAIIAKAKGGQR